MFDWLYALSTLLSVVSTGARSSRLPRRYNKNAKYEQELVRDEQRRFINRAKRRALSAHAQPPLSSADEDTSRDVEARTSQQDEDEEWAALSKIQLKRGGGGGKHGGGVWKRTKVETQSLGKKRYGWFFVLTLLLQKATYQRNYISVLPDDYLVIFTLIITV